LLIDPVAAKAYEITHPPVVVPPGSNEPRTSKSGSTHPKRIDPEETLPSLAKTFYGSADVTPATAKMRLVTIAEEIIAVLSGDPNATVKVTLEITADFPGGVSDQIKRAVSENAANLSFKNKTWEIMHEIDLVRCFGTI
jgi:hypothetical protein